MKMYVGVYALADAKKPSFKKIVREGVISYRDIRYNPVRTKYVERIKQRETTLIASLCERRFFFGKGSETPLRTAPDLF